MTLTETLSRSVNNLQVLVEIDISQLNEEWVNIGAGIWKVNAEGLYPEIDDTWETGLTAQEFGYIGSVYEDSVQLVQVDSLAELTTQKTAFYYDPDTRTLYVRCTNYDNPLMHVIHIGVINPVSYKDYDISGLSTHVAGRLVSIPNVSIARDILFWGRLRYGGGSVQLINSDGEYDDWGENNNLFGNEVRIKIGNPDLTYDDYITISTRNIETVDISEKQVNISIIDRRKYLSKQIRFAGTNQNAVEAIQAILVALGYTYGSTLYDTDAWETAIAGAGNITVRQDLQDADKSEEAITVIEWISLATFGTLQMTADNKFTFALTDTDKAVSTTISADDVRNAYNIKYNPREVITSVQVGYAKDWTDDSYTYYLDSTRETTVFKKYKTYKQQKLKTVLPALSDAQSFTNTFMDYVDETKGVFNVNVPLKYYQVELSDTVNIEVKRTNSDMIGLRKCEVIGKQYILDNLYIQFTLRIIGDQDTILYDTDGFYMLTADNKLLVVG